MKRFEQSIVLDEMYNSKINKKSAIFDPLSLLKIDRKIVTYTTALTLPLILAASMLFFKDQRNNSFGSYVVGGFLGAFIFNLTQEFFFSMSLTIQSSIVAISLIPYLLLLIIFYFTYKRI